MKDRLLNSLALVFGEVLIAAFRLFDPDRRHRKIAAVKQAQGETPCDSSSTPQPVTAGNTGGIYRIPLSPTW